MRDGSIMHMDRLDTLKKPLILLYPTSDTLVDVSLSYISGFSATFPEYDISKK
jgi:hypothetical protein